MNHKEKLLEIYNKSFDLSDLANISEELMAFVKNITDSIDKNKGVYTVLVTLLVHKILEPKQDIRYFQDKMRGGFSARSIDTKFITPTLKELGLLSMAESGWLTRSLEQPYPYTLNYRGEISGKDMKESFLTIIDRFQKDPSMAESLLRTLLNSAILFKESNHVDIEKIKEGDGILISSLIDLLEKHFNEKYETHGGSKLPVLAFHSIYKTLISELSRYAGCDLAPLGSHTASDRTSKTSGDIQVFKNGKLFEVVEVKLDKPIDITMVRIAYEKILRFNPERYYILSNVGILHEDQEEINKLIYQIKNDHGCQLIVNGLINSLKYYIRLVSNLKEFFNEYIKLVETDTELKTTHKIKLKELVKEYAL